MDLRQVHASFIWMTWRMLDTADVLCLSTSTVTCLEHLLKIGILLLDSDSRVISEQKNVAARISVKL